MTMASKKSSKPIAQRLVRRGLSFLLHPVWHYSVREIARCVKEDWEGVGSRAELEEIIVHAEVHGAYRRSGYQQMTTRQKYIWNQLWRRSVERADAEEGDSPNNALSEHQSDNS